MIDPSPLKAEPKLPVLNLKAETVVESNDFKNAVSMASKVADYAYKVYEIVAKAILGFVKSFKKNVKYGNDLLILCDEQEFEFENQKGLKHIL